MIKFFRKIRQRLLIENRFSKYLLYAVGEIILVVIGILIALQINNWNEERLSSKFELQMLTSLKEGLTTDLADIDFNIKYTTRGITKTDTILKYLRTEQPKDLDTIASWFSDAMTPTRFHTQSPGFPGSLRPLNFLALKYDQEFLYFFKSLKNRSLLLIKFHYAKLRAKVVDLIAHIDQEISEKD